MSGNGRAITAHEATVKTATVEIKAMAIGRRQVTQSVFRQLQDVPLVDVETGDLKGTPWGTVNYFWKDCHWADSRTGPVLGVAMDHLHVVWQDGDQLRRSAVWNVPNRKVFEDWDHRVSHCHELVGDLLVALAGIVSLGLATAMSAVTISRARQPGLFSGDVRLGVLGVVGPLVVNAIYQEDSASYQRGDLVRWFSYYLRDQADDPDGFSALGISPYRESDADRDAALAKSLAWAREHATAEIVKRVDTLLGPRQGETDWDQIAHDLHKDLVAQVLAWAAATRSKRRLVELATQRYQEMAALDQLFIAV